jgi:DNA-binding PadR family transcriptional regulator
MSLTHAILGFLEHQPQTGYDLKTEQFDDSVAHFWPADQAQIYRTLDKLTGQGLVEAHVEIQQDRPNRKIYHITEAGRAELESWLHTFQPVPVHREPFLIQLFFAQELPNETILRLLQQQVEAHEAKLEQYRQIDIPRPDDVRSVKGKRTVGLRQLTLDLGIRSEELTLDWLHQAMETVRNLPDHE